MLELTRAFFFSMNRLWLSKTALNNAKYKIIVFEPRILDGKISKDPQSLETVKPVRPFYSVTHHCYINTVYPLAGSKAELVFSPTLLFLQLTFARFYLPMYAPNAERAIYLDDDVIVQGKVIT